MTMCEGTGMTVEELYGQSHSMAGYRVRFWGFHPRDGNYHIFRVTVFGDPDDLTVPFLMPRFSLEYEDGGEEAEVAEFLVNMEQWLADHREAAEARAVEV